MMVRVKMQEYLKCSY